MDVLLKKDVDNLGKAGEVVSVADGYARNFLLPRGLAVAATSGAIKQAELERAADVRRHAEELNEAKALAKVLDEMSVSFQARAGETDRLYGSITKAQIAEALEAKSGREVDRRKIDLDEPIKELGAHAVTIRFAPGAEAKITVVVEREEEE
ncbi:MAG TPA: 50S ribosomal protein L9 [Anaerolineae bacterium]|nr:50S ribosomal protein L9 [Anaerolineae bacterium]